MHWVLSQVLRGFARRVPDLPKADASKHSAKVSLSPSCPPWIPLYLSLQLFLPPSSPTFFFETESLVAQPGSDSPPQLRDDLEFLILLTPPHPRSGITGSHHLAWFIQC